MLWQAEIRRDAFMVLCLRCDAAAMTAQTRGEVLAQLEGEAVGKQVREALQLRQRWQVPCDFPIVGGADVADLGEVIQRMLAELKDIVGICPITQVQSTGVMGAATTHSLMS